MSRLTTQFAEIRQDELDDLHKEISRLRDLIIQIGDMINCDDGGPEQVCLDVVKIIDAEISPTNATDHPARSARVHHLVGRSIYQGEI